MCCGLWAVEMVVCVPWAVGMERWLSACCGLWRWRERVCLQPTPLRPHMGVCPPVGAITAAIQLHPHPHAGRMQHRQANASAGRALHVRIVSDQFSQAGALYVYIAASQYKAQAPGLDVAPEQRSIELRQSLG